MTCSAQCRDVSVCCRAPANIRWAEIPAKLRCFLCENVISSTAGNCCGSSKTTSASGMFKCLTARRCFETCEEQEWRTSFAWKTRKDWIEFACGTQKGCQCNTLNVAGWGRSDSFGSRLWLRLRDRVPGATGCRVSDKAPHWTAARLVQAKRNSAEHQTSYERVDGSLESGSISVVQHTSSAYPWFVDSTTLDAFFADIAWVWLASYCCGVDSDTGETQIHFVCLENKFNVIISLHNFRTIWTSRSSTWTRCIPAMATWLHLLSTTSRSTMTLIRNDKG